MLVSLLAGSAWLGLAVHGALGCPFCSNQGKTLAENVNEASLVVYAQLANARQTPTTDPDKPTEQTDMTIVKVIKSHPILAGRKQFVLPRYIGAAEKESVKYLLFAEVVKGTIDPYRGLPVDNPRFVDYLAESVRLAKAPPKERLAFFFRHLDDKDEAISRDAYSEFAAAPYKDVAAASSSYDPQRVAGWLKDKDTPSYKIGLFGLLLGTCGGPEHAKLLRELIDDKDKRPLTGIDGMLGGYAILDPAAGTKLVLDILRDPKNDFNFRYAALRTVRFLLTELPKADQKQIFAGLEGVIATPDMSDLVIDELRKNQVWSALPKVLAIYAKENYDQLIIRRSVIRFALRCPGDPAAKFIAGVRAKDPQLVADVEEILRFEEAPAAPGPSAAAPSGSSASGPALKALPTAPGPSAATPK